MCVSVKLFYLSPFLNFFFLYILPSCTRGCAIIMLYYFRCVRCAQAEVATGGRSCLNLLLFGRKTKTNYPENRHRRYEGPVRSKIRTKKATAVMTTATTTTSTTMMTYLTSGLGSGRLRGETAAKEHSKGQVKNSMVTTSFLKCPFQPKLGFNCR